MNSSSLSDQKFMENSPGLVEESCGGHLSHQIEDRKKLIQDSDSFIRSLVTVNLVFVGHSVRVRFASEDSTTMEQGSKQNYDPGAYTDCGLNGGIGRIQTEKHHPDAFGCEIRRRPPGISSFKRSRRLQSLPLAFDGVFVETLCWGLIDLAVICQSIINVLWTCLKCKRPLLGPWYSSKIAKRDCAVTGGAPAYTAADQNGDQMSTERPLPYGHTKEKQRVDQVIPNIN
ncbi:hypothetical protein C8J56DRAFT_896610 [Mycena floridula]|nr:hypothetical protein C8J56DRAFT_896610 [Mycena floridula]